MIEDGRGSGGRGKDRKNWKDGKDEKDRKDEVGIGVNLIASSRINTGRFF